MGPSDEREPFDSAIQALRSDGGVILYPTETVYGLGGRAADGRSASRIGAIKGRGLRPLIVLLNAPPPDLPPLAAALGAAFWPGPLTLIVPAWDGLAPEILGPEGTVGVRVSPHPVARALIQAVGPITSTSANRHGDPPARSLEGLALPVDAAIDVGALPPASPSTLVDGRTGQILREGDLAPEIRRLLAAGGFGA